MKVWENRKFLFCCVLLLTGHTSYAQNFEDCQQVIPPYSWGGIDVDHVFGGSVDYIPSSNPTIQLCIGTGFFVPLPQIHLGSHNGLCEYWEPFVYTLNFSEAITSISFMILAGGHGIDSIDFGAENFIIKAECSNVSIESLFSCNSMILGDTIYVGVIIDNFGVGNGWFKVNFSQPVSSFSISGKGGGVELILKYAPTPCNRRRCGQELKVQNCYVVRVVCFLSLMVGWLGLTLTVITSMAVQSKP